VSTAVLKLTETDQGHLKCAEGWLELGDHLSAFEELERIEVSNRAHPAVLKLRWRVYNKAEKHGNAFTIAEGLTRLLPDDPEMFIWRSHSVRRMQGGGSEQALQLLLDVANDFPNETAVPFDLARYNCALGKLVEAKNWLHLAFEVAERNGTASEWKARTLNEPDLAPLRKQFGF
jgi:hypothetical protein